LEDASRKVLNQAAEDG